MKKALLLRSCAMFAVPLMASAVLSTTAQAQQITTEISGQVTDEAGAPIANATVTVTDTRTGASSDFTTNAQGAFSARNLSTGGPYTVTAIAPNFQGQTVNDITTTLQGATQLSFSLSAVSAEATNDTIVVTAARARIKQLDTGPGTSFSAEVLETAPTFNRDIRDVIRIDPRVSLDRDETSGQDRVSCLGGNDRGNAFTVDGIAQSDVYGLNETGFSARTSTPLPYDAIRETQVQFAPFDVEYGQFTGCAINVVTRGGTNQIHGGAFFEYTNEDLTSDRVDGRDIAVADFKDKRWGVSLGGPVIKDRLFLFGAYESRKSAEPQTVGPVGLGYSTEITRITEQNFNDISAVLRDTYGVDTGPLGFSLPFINERWFGRADLQITDDHRLEATFQRIEEAREFTDDLFSTSTSPQLVGRNTYATSGSVSNFYSGRLYSKWTDNVSSELRYSRAKITDRQDPIGGGEAQSADPIPRILVGVNNGSGPGVVLAGPGSNRSANDLRNTIQQYKAAVNVGLGDHNLKFGAELNKADIFNLFVANATGTLVFRNINDLKNGILSNGTNTGTFPDQVTTGQSLGAQGNFTASGNINDAAAEFQRNIYTLYAQDEWRANEDLNIVFGLRVDWFDGDRPALNKNFVERYGFANDTGFSDVDPIVLPRISATYDLNDFAIFRQSKVRGGFGIFSGGDPLVWFGNAFQNDGAVFGLGRSDAAACGAGPIDVVNSSGVFTGFPSCVVSAGSGLAGVGQAATQSVDPEINMPTVQRFNIGFETRLDFGPGVFSGWRFNTDFILSRYRDPFTVVDLAQAVSLTAGLNGYTIDGRPIYRQVNLTAPGCTADLIEPAVPPRFRGLTAACFVNSGANARVDEIMLTNSRGYTSKIASFLLSKDFGRGVITPGGGVYLSAGYAYTDAKDRRNLYNSTATSNYDRTVNDDRQDPDVSRGYYSQKHNVTFSTTFRERFFSDLDTKFGVTFVARSGRPYSLTFTGSGDFSSTASGSDNALAYIPNGPDDPNVVYVNGTIDGVARTAAQIEEAYLAFIEGNKCARKARGSTIGRNTCDNDWYYDMDLRLSQELPGFGRLLGVKDTFEVFAVMDNFLNFLDDKWNVFRRRNIDGQQDIVDLATTGVDAQGRYVINGFTGTSYDVDNQIKDASSQYRVKIGVSYKF